MSEKIENLKRAFSGYDAPLTQAVITRFEPLVSELETEEARIRAIGLRPELEREQIDSARSSVQARIDALKEPLLAAQLKAFDDELGRARQQARNELSFLGSDTSTQISHTTAREIRRVGQLQAIKMAWDEAGELSDPAELEALADEAYLSEDEFAIRKINGRVLRRLNALMTKRRQGTPGNALRTAEKEALARVRATFDDWARAHPDARTIIRQAEQRKLALTMQLTKILRVAGEHLAVTPQQGRQIGAPPPKRDVPAPTHRSGIVQGAAWEKRSA